MSEKQHWTEDVVKFLEEMYLEPREVLCERLANKTWKAIKTKINRLGSLLSTRLRGLFSEKVRNNGKI